MADRYWVGGSADWDGTAGSKWATTSGGAGGASVPTSADDVFFTNLSTGTCQISVGNTGAKSIDFTGFTGVLSGNVDITISGSITLGSGMTRTYTGTMTINGTATLTSNGVNFPSITVNGSSITVQLADALSCGNLIVTQGTFNASGYNVTCNAFSSSNSNTRTVTMGSGLWTMTASGSTVWNTSTTTGLTFNAGTANILFSSNTTSDRFFVADGQSFNKLTIGGTGTPSLFRMGAPGCTFTELASTKTVAHTVESESSGTTTINKWSITGSSGNIVTFRSNSAGTSRSFDITEATNNIDYLAVQDINITQANKFYVGSNSINNGNNTNVIFAQATPSNFLLFFI